MPETLENMNLRIAQMQQIISQYRISIYTTELRAQLLIKMLEEKGLFVADEFEKRWPMYLKNDVGVMGADGVMEGSIKISFYGEK